MTKQPRLPASLDGALAGVAVVAVWEIGVRLAGVPSYLLPPPSAIVARLYSDAGSLAYNAAITASEIAIGFLLSIVVSISLAAVLVQIRALERALYPVLVASQTVPKVAIAPLLVVWFGFGLTSKILIAFLICFFPIVVDSLVGFRSVPKEVTWLASSMGASRWQRFLHFQVPGALPSIFAGVKVASTLSIVGAVVGEFVAADRGLGYQLIVANGSLDITLSFAVLLVLTLMGVLLFGAVDLVERWLLPWHISHRRGEGG